MTFNSNSNGAIVNILNEVLRNINEDISFLRADFRKLNDIVITLSVKSEETANIKTDLKHISTKIDIILERIIELEKAREKLQDLISHVDVSHSSAEELSAINNDRELDSLKERMKGYDDKMPYLLKALAVIFALICIILYSTKTYELVFAIISKFF